MRNILFWVGIAALALQDYFKKQPVKATRQQQFLQTGETSQAFIEGTTYSEYKKILVYYFGKPEKEIIKDSRYYSWNVKTINIKLNRSYDFMIVNYGYGYPDKYQLVKPLLENVFSEIAENIFQQLYQTEKNKDYKKLYEMAAAGDWRLALEIAKGQGLL